VWFVKEFQAGLLAAVSSQGLGGVHSYVNISVTARRTAVEFIQDLTGLKGGAGMGPGICLLWNGFRNLLSLEGVQEFVTLGSIPGPRGSEKG
jgi:hypothetical protein